MEFQLKGRIDSAEQHNGRYYTVVTTPAPDQFSHPSRFKVGSQQPIGTPGQHIQATVSVRGIVREKSYRDKNTGMMKTFNEDSIFLDVVNVQPLQVNQKPAA